MTRSYSLVAECATLGLAESTTAALTCGRQHIERGCVCTATSIAPLETCTEVGRPCHKARLHVWFLSAPTYTKQGSPPEKSSHHVSRQGGVEVDPSRDMEECVNPR
ncbi:hypothetical protein BDP55DRAFT_35783 [Colletotrichum godetiae]|uniref:Uncharacterized protein n=1 Tax=Colletotrichum godetiae TaxID=1209918 RepID=A0AAJ0A8V3_9PEZI|nr:uncharacterized protein BDP55DRAFT_35783 [Colletotrichum godetiae]KAK1657191.1 hypothetical protein BDP55DRAFT_35783 [Colletotrichum godetiae]